MSHLTPEFYSQTGLPVSICYLETGCFKGKNLEQVVAFGYHQEYHSIELSKKWYQYNKDRFSSHKNVFLHHGDSKSLIPKLWANLPSPKTIFLDAHYSGPDTELGEEETPLLEELRVLKLLGIDDESIIIIDDTRLLGNRGELQGGGDYAPFFSDWSDITFEAIQEIIGPDYVFLKNDKQTMSKGKADQLILFKATEKWKRNNQGYVSINEGSGQDTHQDITKQIYFFPDYRNSNHYQSNLYCEANRFSFDAEPLGSPFDFPLDADFLHFHWLPPIWQYLGQTLEEFLKSGIEEFFDNLRRFSGKKIWTCHNWLSHEASNDQELTFVKRIVEEFDIVHVMNSSTLSLLKTIVEIDPAKVMNIPHSSYEGVLKRDELNSEEVRNRLGISSDSIILGFMGLIRPYKNVPLLLEAFSALQKIYPQVFLLIVGSNSTPEVVNSEKLRQITDRFLLVDHFLGEDQFSEYGSIIDIAVYPYSRILNSGSIASSATMGHHIVVPDLPSLRFEPGLDFVSYFSAGDVNDLTKVVSNLIRDGSFKTTRTSAIKWSIQNSPSSMSLKFFTGLVSQRDSDA